MNTDAAPGSPQTAALNIAAFALLRSAIERDWYTFNAILRRWDRDGQGGVLASLVASAAAMVMTAALDGDRDAALAEADLYLRKIIKADISKALQAA